MIASDCLNMLLIGTTSIRCKIFTNMIKIIAHANCMITHMKKCFPDDRHNILNNDVESELDNEEDAAHVMTK